MGEVSLRDVQEEDIPTLFEHQRDEEASRMAAFPSREREAHAAHWARILADDSKYAKAIVRDGVVVGNVVSWVPDGGRREVGYWIGKEHWGKGIATEALRQFVAAVPERPLQAFVATHNAGSIRVLEKCGFVRTGASIQEDGVEKIELELS